MLGLVGAVEFHELIVNAEQEKRGRPLADEKGVVPAAAEFQREREADGGKGRPQEGIRGELGGLGFDGFCDGAFAMSLALCGVGGVHAS